MSEAKELTSAILDALVASVGDAIWASELMLFQGSRRVDFWTISANSSAGFDARAYEIKVSRADFRRDSHEKQRGARLFSDRFFYVTPSGLIQRDEVPDWAGLIEFSEGKLSTVVPAPRRDKDGPTWELVVSMIRNAGQLNRDTSVLKQRLHYAEQQIRSAKKWCEANGQQAWQLGLHG